MTVRIAPVGIRLGDGYQSLITFDADPNVSLWEKTVKPPGVDGGDAIDTTTMWNEVVRTKSSRALKEMTDGGMSCGYDPRVLDQIIALINVETLITTLFPDGSRWEAYGFLKSAEPNNLEEGTFPILDCVIVYTNTDPADGSESLPNYFPVGSADS